MASDKLPYSSVYGFMLSQHDRLMEDTSLRKARLAARILLYHGLEPGDKTNLFAEEVVDDRHTAAYISCFTPRLVGRKSVQAAFGLYMVASHARTSLEHGAYTLDDPSFLHQHIATVGFDPYALSGRDLISMSLEHSCLVPSLSPDRKDYAWDTPEAVAVFELIQRSIE